MTVAHLPFTSIAAASLSLMASVCLAAPSASVDGYAQTTSGFDYQHPGAASDTTMVSISHNRTDMLTFSAAAGGGSISGAAHPFIALTSYAYNDGSFITVAGASAGTWSAFYVAAKPGFDPLDAGTIVPVKVNYTSMLRESFGTTPVGWNANESYNMAFYFDDVNWRGYNQSGTLSGNVRYGETHSVGIYTSVSSHTQNVVGPGAWANAELSASVMPYVDPVWNEAHGDGYQVYYVSLGPPVPEPSVHAMLLAGLAAVLVSVAARRRYGA